MRSSPKIWAILSVLLLLGAILCWQLGERRRPAPPISAPPAATNALAQKFQLLSAAAKPGVAAGQEAVPTAAGKQRYPHQLTNTRKSIAQLLGSETAVLLQNALIETAEGTSLPIPAHLRSAGDPAAYIVQARGPVDDSFRHQLAAAGAVIVAYIPNNAYLVRADADGAERLKAAVGTQSLIPYEPYFKFDTNLLAQAVIQKPLADGQRLNVTGFPGEQGWTRTALESLGAKVLFEERSPFGPKFMVEPPAGALVAIAQSPLVQHVETWHPRQLLNDFARRRLNVVSNTLATTLNYLNLTGNNITVNVNDTGVDSGHPDLSPRVTADVAGTLLDFDGHGTHVAGAIASSGGSGTLGTNASGSVVNANMRGMAPNAKLYALPILLNTGPVLGDTYLQTNAGTENYSTLARTNPIVSNNSWGYLGDNTYSSAAASFDAAVRDGLPETGGMQEMIYVFAAGNEGFGGDTGTGGLPDRISSPGTAKNVITVGGLENARNITNTIPVTNLLSGMVTTQAVFLPLTDSSNQVASFSSRGNVGVGLEGPSGRFKPDVVAPATFTVSTRSSQWVLTNSVPANSPLFPPLNALNNNLVPYYRYETGTSMAAPAVSGVVALMQEFFEVNLAKGYSPALIKALLINGARAANTIYDFGTSNIVNYQGWGVVNITNSIPASLATPLQSSLVFFDQDATNALATGGSQSYLLTVPPDASNAPLRITIVWTDPPGNPAAAVKLVNNLDLLVEELDPATGQTNVVYQGNSFPAGTSYSEPTLPPSVTNSLPPFDEVNNVENVYINLPLAAQYRITVKGARVNVNAVTANPTNTAQDYALVISSARAALASTFVITPTINPIGTLPVLVLTNGLPTYRNRVGANSPLLGGFNGLSNQWNFYVFTNLPNSNSPATLTNGTNVAFVTFRPPNLSRPRNLEADLDFYVSQNSLITNLNPGVLATAFKSVGRGGTEAVVVPGAALGDIYFIAVKSEDQQASEYSLLAISTDQPFGRTNANGDIIISGTPLGPIPDGTAENPGELTFLCINAVMPQVLLRAVITNTVTHQLHGDIFSSIDFNTNSIVLHPHDLVGDTNSGTITYIYDDSGRMDIPGSKHTGDGMASLNDLAGSDTYLVPWLVTFSDNATNHLGSVASFEMLLERIPDTNDMASFFALGAGFCRFGFVDVPANVTNLQVDLSQLTGPVDVYLRRDVPPTTNLFDKYASISPPGGALSCSIYDTPPLVSPGRYFVMVCNTNTFPVTGYLQFIFQYGLTPINRLTYVATNVPFALKDDAFTYGSIQVSNTNSSARIVDVRVGLRVDHPRISDLAFHLISPQGRRVLLIENRGLDTATNYGFNFAPPPTNPTSTVLLSNYSWLTFTESSNLAPLLIKFAPVPFASTNPIPMAFDYTNSFEAPPAATTIIATNVAGTVFDGWLVETNYVAVITDTNLALQGVNFLALSGGRVSSYLPTTNDRDYVLNFSYKKVSSAATQAIGMAVRATAYLDFATNPLLPGATAPVAVPRMRLCPGQLVAISASNCTISDLTLVCRGPEGDTNNLTVNGLPLFGLVGQWSRSPRVLETNTTWGLPFYIGTNAVLTAPLDPGDYFLFLAENDSDYTTNSGAFDVTVEWQQCQLSAFDWVLGGVTNILFAENYWQTNSVIFTGNPATTNFAWQSNWNYTVIFDKVELFQPISAVFYQPEESLDWLQNELGVGQWRLEVWDSRVGPLPGPTNGMVLGWYLQIQFAPAPPAVPLTNCVTYTNLLRPGEIRYFSVAVPFEATVATNILTGPGAVELLYSATGLPVGSSPPDPLYPVPNFFLIDTTNPLGAPLVPGGTYFLGVRNLSAVATNPFTLTVNFNLPLLMLDNNLSNCVFGVTNTISANSNSVPAVTNILFPGTNMHWYKYFVFPDTNSSGVTFELSSTNGDVQLVAKRALPVVNYLPGPLNFDYQSVDRARGQERIVVLTNSFPTSLQPVLWLVGVYNVGLSNADYRLTACQWTNTPAPPPLYQASAPYVTNLLANDVPANFVVAPNNTLDFYAQAILDQTNSAVIFEICGLRGDADLLVRRSDYPSKTLYDFSDFKVGSQDEYVVLKTNIYIPQVNATNWWLTVVNRQPFPVSGMIRYMVSTNGMVTNCASLSIIAPSFAPSSGTFKFNFYTIPGVQYWVEATTNLTEWTTVTNFTAQKTTTGFADPISTNRFYRIRQITP